MTLRPHHIAAAQYSIVGIFLVASWHLLLSPFDRALMQLELIFADGYENRLFFICFALASVATLLPAVAFWFPRSTSPPLAITLAVWAAGIFGLAVWQFDSTLIFGFGLGLALAVWSWHAPNTALNGGRADTRRAG